MKILWLTYVMFPEAKAILSGGQNNQKGSGGWLFGAAEALLCNTNVELRVAIVSRQVNQYKEVKGEKIYYYLIPWGKGFETINNGYDIYWQKINAAYDPDVVHVHGIESTLCHSYIHVCGNEKVVASIQGLKGVIARYFRYGISLREIICNRTINDIVLRRGIIKWQRRFQQYGKYEETMLKELKYVIGRTEWDFVHVWKTNDKIKYFKCEETLRNVFYTGRWNYNDCNKYSIFLSAANASFKGAHQLFKAMPYVIKQFPNTTIRIAGNCDVYPHSVIEKLKQSGYERYLSSLIKKYNLRSKITFLGLIDANRMKEEYLSANVFVCPSTIENSSNSIAEAQLLGVPVVATYVGGVEDMIPNKKCGEIVRFEEVEMLAYKICKLFAESPTTDNATMQAIAKQRHDPKVNAKRTLEIYQSIIDSNSHKR